jgi:hypothetical protein
MASEAHETASELRRVLALAAGTAVYIVCMALVAILADNIYSSFSSTASGIPSIWIAAWGFGGLIASTLAVEAARRVAAAFNRVGLAVILVVLALLFIGVVFLGLNASGSDGAQAFGPVLSLIGTIVGLARELPALRKKAG